MTTLTIQVLAVTEEMDAKAMPAVRGGKRKSMNQVIAETAQMPQDISSGKCEFSSTGKSYVCY